MRTRKGTIFTPAINQKMLDTIRENPFITTRRLIDELQLGVSPAAVIYQLKKHGVTFGWATPGQTRVGTVFTQAVNQRILRLTEKNPLITTRQLIAELKIAITPNAMRIHMKKLGFIRSWEAPAQGNPEDLATPTFTVEINRKIWALVNENPLITSSQISAKLGMDIHRVSMGAYMKKRGFTYRWNKIDTFNLERAESTFTPEINLKIRSILEADPLITLDWIIDGLGIKISHVSMTIQLAKLGYARCWQIPENAAL